MAHEFQYLALGGRWYMNFGTLLLGAVVHEFCYLALGRWYINLSTMLSRDSGT